METTKIALFKGKKIRKKLHENEWWFSVVDVVEALTDSLNPRDYWFKMKVRVKEEDGFEPSTICRQLKLPAPDPSPFFVPLTMRGYHLPFWAAREPRP